MNKSVGGVKKFFIYYYCVLCNNSIYFIVMNAIIETPIKQQTESISFSKSLTPATIAEIIVSEGKLKSEYRDMRTAQRYFDGHNDIETKSRVYYDKDKKKHDNPAASNARVKSNFFRQLVQQKQDYGFAKTFVLKLSNEKEDEVDLTKDEYGAAWKQFCDEQLFKKAYALAGQAVNNGIAWCYVWIDENGDLRLKDIPSDLVYPVWRDRQHTSLDYLVYNFIQLRYNSFSPDQIEYAELWTPTERRLFNVSNGYSEENDFTDTDGNPIFSQMTGGVNWEKIPYIAFKGTSDEKSLLYFVKEQIDSYDKLDSHSIDALIDDLDPLLILKGISPSVSSLIEARELAKLTRTMALDTDGDAHYIQAQTAISAYLEKMQALRKDIFKFGNPNQLTIRSLYQDLDTYTDGLERHFQNFIDNLKYFFDKWWELTGRGSFDIAQSYKVLVKLDRSMMINQSSQIADTVQLMNTGVSQKTVMEFNPIVQDVEMEMARLEEEKKEKEAENQLFNFPTEKQSSEQTEKGESE